VLSDGDWRTTIEPGSILLEGPNGATARISLGHEVVVDGKPTRLLEPHVTVLGASAANRPASHVTITAKSRDGEIIVAGVPDRLVQPFVKDGKSLGPWIGIGAGGSDASIHFWDRGKSKLVLPSR